MRTVEGKGLGWIVDPLDDRDYLARDRVLRAVGRDVPARVDWDAPRAGRTSSLGPVLNQADTPTCVAHGIATIKTFFERRDHRRTYRWQPHEFYGRCKARDGIPTLPGTYPRVALDLLREEGIGREQRDYDRDAGGYRILSYQRLLTIDEMEAALTLGPLVIGLAWYSRWTWRVRGVLPDTAGDQEVGGHLLVVSGYDSEANVFKLRNSWGQRAHDSGTVYISYAEVERQLRLPDYLSADAWAIVDERRGGRA